MKRYHLWMCALALLIAVGFPVAIKAETVTGGLHQSALTNTVSTDEFNAMLQKATGKSTDYTKNFEYYKNLELKDGAWRQPTNGADFTSFNLDNQSEITVANATAMAGKAIMDKNGKTWKDIYYHGLFGSVDFPTWTESKYVATLYYGRIKDINKVDNGMTHYVGACYTNGLYVGKQGANFSTSRTFGMNNKLTVTQAKDICNKIVNKSKRTKFSSDMQVVRTTKLPKNAKAFKQILASFPNYYYEQIAIAQDFNGNANPCVKIDSKYIAYKPAQFVKHANANDKAGWFRLGDKVEVGYETYESPRDYVVRKAIENVKLTLSFDYRNTKQWKEDLFNTYKSNFDNDKEYNADVMKSINALANLLASKKFVTECKYAVADYDSIYQDQIWGQYVRVAAKFRYVSGTHNIKGDMYCVPTLYGKNGKALEGKFADKKYGEWIEVVVDVPITLDGTDGMTAKDVRVLPYRMWDTTWIKKIKVVK